MTARIAVTIIETTAETVAMTVGTTVGTTVAIVGNALACQIGAGRSHRFI